MWLGRKAPVQRTKLNNSKLNTVIKCNTCMNNYDKFRKVTLNLEENRIDLERKFIQI